ncbi:hypothetical protein POM88_040720 [Heracleum sosnowskyi]|uniref:Uncharacterized protein n=1 Tax=Heracleum sosnowskyi TaxID=360622 RepID=A0AAD8HF08_9APIA|nr:hypothetical protein POM88_040720 [Heracleum sosnowskyi]
MKLNTDNKEANADGDDLFSCSLVGDGGATWRHKALERSHAPHDNQTVCKRSKMDVSSHHPCMLIPTPADSLTWKKGISHQRMSSEDACLLFSALARLNKVPDDRSAAKPAMSANQIAAKVMQLRIKGKHQEADRQKLSIPLPAPLYFKKAIDEAEDEWSHDDAKKLTDTSVKGLRG